MPIGNLNDISERAIEVLNNVDTILCEDTKTTVELLRYHSIQRVPLISYHKHTPLEKLEKILNALKKVDHSRVMASHSN